MFLFLQTITLDNIFRSSQNDRKKRHKKLEKHFWYDFNSDKFLSLYDFLSVLTDKNKSRLNYF